MRFSLASCWLIVALTVLAQGLGDINATNITQPHLSTNTTASRRLLQYYGTDDATTSGNYQILLCGAGQPNSKAAKLQYVFSDSVFALMAPITVLETRS